MKYNYGECKNGSVHAQTQTYEESECPTTAISNNTETWTLTWESLTHPRNTHTHIHTHTHTSCDIVHNFHSPENTSDEYDSPAELCVLVKTWTLCDQSHNGIVSIAKSDALNCDVLKCMYNYEMQLETEVWRPD